MQNGGPIGNWPFDVWNIITGEFASLLSEENVIIETKKKRCVALLDALPQPQRNIALVPFQNPHSNEYNAIKGDLCCFNLCLFGQLFSIFHHDCFESLRQKCLSTQTELLRHLWKNDPYLYRVILGHYVGVLQDLRAVVENANEMPFKPMNFLWFDFISLTKELNLPKPSFKVNNFELITELTNLTLLLLVSQMQYISNLCRTVSNTLWDCLLALLKKRSNKALVYECLTSLLREEKAKSYEIGFNGKIGQLLTHVMDDVATLCQTGKLPQESSFCALLDTLQRTIWSDTCFDCSYTHRFYLLLLQRQVPMSKTTEEIVLKLFNKLLRLSRHERASIDFESDLSVIDLPLLCYLIRRKIDDAVGRLRINDAPRTMNVYRSSQPWRHLLEQTLNQIRSRNSEQVKSAFEIAKMITNLAVNVTYEFVEVEFVFFEENRCVELVQALTNICESQTDGKLLTTLMKVIRDVLMLRETQRQDAAVQTCWMQILCLRWIPTQCQLASQDALSCRYNPLNDEIREICLAGAMLARFKSNFKQWRDDFFKAVWTNCTPNVVRVIPILANDLDDSDAEIFLSGLLALNEGTLAEVSTHVRPLICALSGCCVLRKSFDEEIQLHCRVCNECDTPAVIARAPMLTAFVVRLMQSSDRAKYNVIAAAVRLFNHIPKTEDLLGALRNCFVNCESRICQKIVEITPYVIFGGRLDRYEFDESVFQSLTKCLCAVCLEALVNEDADMQYTVLTAITKIGCIPLEDTIRPSILILLMLMLSAASSHGSLAKSCIQQVAIAHNVDNEEHIYLKYAEHVFPLVVRLMVTNFTTYNVNLAGLQCDHTSIFNNMTANHVLQYLLPHVAEDGQVRALVDELAATCNTSTANLLRNAFRQVFPHVMLFESLETVAKVMGIIKEETNHSINDLLSCCVTKVLAELFIHYEKHETKVKWVLSEIKRVANSSREVTESSIESFLQSRFFGVLMKLENQLCTDTISQATKRRVLSSFKSIIRYMSSAYVTSVRFKVLYTLRAIGEMERGSRNNAALCVEIWDAFVRRIDIATLGPILANIFVSLLPFVELYAHGVNVVFRYLVIENHGAVEPHLVELYFVEADQCEDVVYERIRGGDAVLAAKPLNERLEWLLEASKHEIIEIKLHALHRLRRELAVNRADMAQLMLASDTVDALVFRVLDALVDGFRSADARIQDASGLCLGEFGALDPSYIPNTVIKADDTAKYVCYAIDDPQFVVKAFMLLCRGLQVAKSSSDMDTFALAIQSLLTSFAVKPDDECKYWNRIPKGLHAIIQPFYATTYKLLTNAGESSYNIPYLIYGSNRALTVQKWAYNWSNFLISLLPVESKHREVFTYCKGPMSCEIECMMLFLPHILLNAVLACDEANLQKIYEEMVSVIRYERSGLSERGESDDDMEANAAKTSTQLVASEELAVMSSTDMEMSVICTKTMFNLLDVLHKKLRDMRWSVRDVYTSEYKHYRDRKGGTDNSNRNRYPSIEEIDAVNLETEKLNKLLNKFSKYQLAEKAFERQEYVRSLLYLEEYLEKDGVDLDKYLVLLAKIYVHLDDVDNVKGLFASHSVKLRQLQNIIMLHEITDQFQDAAICYQQLLKATTDKERALVYEKRMIQCYLSMNQPETALRFVNSLSSTVSKQTKFFYDVESEALWNLSQYDKLEQLGSRKHVQTDDSWGVRIGQSMVHFLKRDRTALHEELSRIRGTLAKSLHVSTAAFGGYRESYEHAIKLHILNEYEKIVELVFNVNENGDDWARRYELVIKNEFEERLRKLQPTSRALQPVLNIRQALFSVAGQLLTSDGRRPELVALFEDEKRKCWLKSIEIANRTRNFQLAYSNIIAIDNYQLKGFFIEKAKYYWEKMEQQEALRTLLRGVEFHFSEYAKSGEQAKNANVEDKEICAEAYILLGEYNETLANIDDRTNLRYFRKAYRACQQSEKTLLKMAQYQDKILKQLPKADWYRTQPETYSQVVEMYGRSLTFGCEFIYQSMSRMLNIWLDFGEKIKEDMKESTGSPASSSAAATRRARVPEDRRKAFVKMNNIIQELIQRKLPAYYFLTAFSLVMSRLSHPLGECFALLQEIVVQCILHFPNQTLWQFMSLYRPRPTEAGSKLLSERVNRVLNDANLKVIQPKVTKYKLIFEELSRLCKAPKSNQIAPGKKSITAAVKAGSTLLKPGHFGEILIPAQKFLTIMLPRAASQNYNPFPEREVFVARIGQEAMVYSSMQRPIRVDLIGTDGNVYPMIFKAMDDLRIDSRAMEFNAVVNMYLKRDVDGRDRGLRIRTYTVLPLIEKCGVIEFVPNLNTMRLVTMEMRRSLGMEDVPVRKHKMNDSDDLEKKRERFLELRKLYKPVLHEWYKMEFPNPSSWYIARSAYVRTLATMSIVGYFLGLGDRHNDNILLDLTNGDVVHVDFNALFNKGETLPVPERVPFRLTHSMVKAMGPLGSEGAFLYTCEIVSRVLRSRKDQLVSVLNTFLYDPSDFFTDGVRNRAHVVELVATNLQNVELRLSGSVRTNKRESSLLSVEGQTKRLIEEATSIDNLCQMFHGWGAYM